MCTTPAEGWAHNGVSKQCQWYQIVLSIVTAVEILDLEEWVNDLKAQKSGKGLRRENVIPKESI